VKEFLDSITRVDILDYNLLLNSAIVADPRAHCSR